MSATSRKAAPDKKPDRREAAIELAGLRYQHRDVYAREKELKAILIEGAEGENYKEIVAGIGVVKVSAPKDKRCTGTAPEIMVANFLMLPPKERDKLKERGIVIEAEQWTNPYYGSVTVDLF